MDIVKKDVIDAIGKLPESVTLEEIMYHLYVIDKVRKGKEAVDRGESFSMDEMKKETQTW